MNKKIVTKITLKETKEIESIFERLNSLEALKITLKNNSKYESEYLELKEKINKDLNEAEEKYENLWSELADNYGLNKEIISRYSLTFSNNTIYLNN